MIRAGGVFNFPEMIAHVNGNKTFRDFTMAQCLSLSRLISPSADKAATGIIKVKRHLSR